MAISLGGFSGGGGGGGASTDTLDDVTSRGATTTNAITVGGVSVGTAYSLPTADGGTNQVLQTNGSGTVSFQTLDFTGGLEYKGAFNATAGTPSLLNAEKGDFYIIDTAGTIYGQTWAIGDHLLINEDMGSSITNSKIDKIDNTQAVTSVNTQTGAVVLSGNDLLADHTAVHYTAANNNIDGHLIGIDTKLGTVASPTLDNVTTNGNTTTNAINVGAITTSGNILADADASRTIGAEATRFITYHGDMNGAIRFKAKNNQGSAISKGQVVYISGVSGTVPEVKLAQANSAATMPAFGLALANANNQAEVQIITFGNLTDYNTTTYSLSANDTVFVSATTAGALTNSAPTGESNLIQNIGRVVRADASAGIIKVGGAGRSNETPNLDQDKIFLGNASNQSVSTALSAINLSKFNNDLPSSSPFTTTTTALATYDASVNEIINLTANTGGEIRVNLPSSASSGDIIILRKPTNTSSATPAGQATKIAVYDNGGTKLKDLELYPVLGSHILSYDGSDWTFPVTNLKYQRSLSNTYTLYDYRFGHSILYADSADTTDFTVNIQVAASSLLEGARQRVISRGDRNIIITSTATDIVDPTNGSSAVVLTNSVTVPAHSGFIEIWVNSQSQYIISAPLANLGSSAFLDSTDFLSATGADTLGGDLDVGTSDIVSSSNNNIEFAANGTGVVKVKPTTSGGHLELDGDGTNVGKLRLMCEESSHGIYLTGPSHSASASYTLKFPDTAGTANYVLKTDGSGNLDWVAQASSGGSAPTVTSASPSANYTISTHADNEEIYILNPSADISVFLPAASTCGSGYKYQIKNLGAYTITIDPNSTEYIDHSGQTTFDIVQYESVTLVTDASNWFII